MKEPLHLLAKRVDNTELMREIELKLEPGAEGARALHSHALLAGVESSRTAQTTTYYDTDDDVIRKAGFSLRLRLSDGRLVQTVKQAAGGEAGIFDRPEWEEDVDGPDLDLVALDRTPLGKLLSRKLRGRLQPRITSQVDRTAWRVERAGSEVELTLDEGTIAAGGAEQPLNELELELKQGDSRALVDLAREIGRTVALRIGVLSKVERGFALADGSLAKATKSVPIRIRRSTSVADSFALIVHACLRQFRLNEPLVVERCDPQALHQARVAMRRLRSALSLFGPLIRDRQSERLRDELRWFTGQFGDARNLDVLLQRLEDAGISVDARTVVEAARAKAYDDVLAALDSQRYRDLMLDLVGWIELGDWRESEDARLPILDLALKRLDRRWRRIKKPGRHLSELEPENRHQVRIHIKKLRYAIEFLSELFEPKRQKHFLSALEKMQEELGYLNDIATARELLVRLPGLDSGSIPEPTPDEERKHLAKAQDGFADLVDVGPFWRDAEDSNDDAS